MGVISDLMPDIDEILGLRDDLGAGLKEVSIVTRTWSGREIGEGEYTERKEQMLPTPRVVEFKHDLRIREGGAVEQGDVLLKMISKERYSDQCMIDGSTDKKNIEKFYDLNGVRYRVINVQEKHVTWSVLLRRQNK